MIYTNYFIQISIKMIKMINHENSKGTSLGKYFPTRFAPNSLFLAMTGGHLLATLGVTNLDKWVAKEF